MAFHYDTTNQYPRLTTALISGIFELWLHPGQFQQLRWHYRLSGVLIWFHRYHVPYERLNTKSNPKILQRPHPRPFQSPFLGPFLWAPYRHHASGAQNFSLSHPTTGRCIPPAMADGLPVEVFPTKHLSPMTSFLLGSKGKEKSRLTFWSEVPKILRKLWNVLFRGGFLPLSCLSGWFYRIYPGDVVG